jgi:resolvase-like protein
MATRTLSLSQLCGNSVTKLLTYRQFRKGRKSALSSSRISRTKLEQEMTTIGYARVSTHGQTLRAQTEALHTAGCARIFAEKISGAYSDRPQLAKALAALSEGGRVQTGSAGEIDQGPVEHPGHDLGSRCNIQIAR